MNFPTGISCGTKNFFFSIAGALLLGDFSTITGILSGYLLLIFSATSCRFSKKLTIINL